MEQQVDIPFVRFYVDRKAAARYGLRAADVADAIETAMAGRSVGVIFSGATTFDLVVRLDRAVVRDVDALSSLPIDTPSGAIVPVSAVARVRREEGANVIGRENVQRRIVVAANVAGRDLGSVIEDIRRIVETQVRMPAGYRVEYGGQFESQQAASRRLAVLGVTSIAGIFLCLVVAFGRVRDVIIVMVNLPLALIGGVAGVFVAGGVLSIASIIGFITLFGIATRNGLMMIAHIHYLIDHAHPGDALAVVKQGAMERLSPILMTALAAGLGLIPLALAVGEPGSEIQAPMAIVILCGLLTSTALNMLVVPALYLRFGSARQRLHPSALPG
jgi:Cu/Ag efflux pump CusA